MASDGTNQLAKIKARVQMVNSLAKEKCMLVFKCLLFHCELETVVLKIPFGLYRANTAKWRMFELIMLKTNYIPI